MTISEVAAVAAEQAKKEKNVDNTMQIETSSNKPKQQQSVVLSPSPRTTSATPTSAQDTHPYARGSVIEVWHIPKKAITEDWWSDPDSSDDEDAAAAADRPKTVRLCDIIDRAPTSDNTAAWKYYVHYRDFNRRMDEWIAMDRIVSPPSVGNAKARALKKQQQQEQERLKKIQQQQQQQQQQQEEEVAVSDTLPRSRRRSATAANVDGETATEGGATTTTTTTTTGRSTRRRLSRRKSSLDMEQQQQTDEDDDNATVQASNASKQQQQQEQQEQNNPKKEQQEKEVVTTDAVTTHTVGEHVVATVKAQELDEHEGLDEASLREHEEVTKVKNVNYLELGEFQMETWYFSPLPKELLGGQTVLEVLYVCEFTFSLFCRKSELRRFQARLPTDKRHPPGNEIYRNGNLAMFEVDGLEEKIYCQNLCYIAKLFLDHKTLYFDVDPFLFYVLCEVDERGFHPVGYYSKEKYSDVGYNLACILTFPSHQRKGYGRFLISFSYELSKKEEKVGSPEKPLSDLGQQAYKPYWASVIVDYLLHQSTEKSLSIMDISKDTSIMTEDIVFTLNQLGILKIINDVYFIAAERRLLEQLASKYPIKKPRVDPSKLHWTPFLTDVKRDKFSIHSKKPSVETDDVTTATTATTTTNNSRSNGGSGVSTA